jgi:hypothetical protein
VDGTNVVRTVWLVDTAVVVGSKVLVFKVTLLVLVLDMVVGGKALVLG